MRSTPSSPGSVLVVARATTGFLVVAAALGILLATGSRATAAGHSVLIEHYAYAPAAMTVDQGDTVTWTNRDTVAHDVTVTSGPATVHSPMLAQGQSWSHTFTAPGSYTYVCSVHPDMRASVTVRAKPVPSPTPKPAQTTTSTRTPAAVPRTTTSTAAAPPGDAAPAPTTPAAVAAPTATQDAMAPSSAGPTLDPLLLVAGLSMAVTVFCLLLMTSRPVASGAEPRPSER